MRVAAATAEQTVLGEGSRWDDRRGEVLRVDILAGRVFRDRVGPDGALTPVRAYDVPGTVGAIAPIAGDPGCLLAAGRGFAYLDADGSLRVVAEATPAGHRMNDAACDAAGRMWAGSLAEDHRAGAGALHRLGRDGRVNTVLDGLTIPNGIGWSPDGRTMYLVDSAPRIVHAIAFDPDSGELGGARALVSWPEETGAPDGLTVDSGGDLWIAVYGGGRVERRGPEGRLRTTYAIPAAQVTSCAFAGTGLDRLYVTTATEGWSDERRHSEPGAGLVYVLDPGTTGRPAAPFRPATPY